jgi:hypothetical protein
VAAGRAGRAFAVGKPVAAGAQPVAIEAADFDRDGAIDLAVANLTTSSVTVLGGDGRGGFAEAGVFAVGKSPAGLAAGDWNGDGRIDLAVVNSGSNDVSVLLGAP